MLYVPDYSDTQCATIRSENVIRVYDTFPRQNATIHYNDLYVNFDYISQPGEQTFSNYSTLPVCLENVSDQWIYRKDFADIMIGFVVIAMFIYVLLAKLLGPIFRRFK